MLFLQLLIVIQVCTITSVDLIQQIIPFPICFFALLLLLLLPLLLHLLHGLFFVVGKLTVFKKNYFNSVDPHFLSFVHGDVGGVHKFATKKKWKTKQITWKFIFGTEKKITTNNPKLIKRNLSMDSFKMLNGRCKYMEMRCNIIWPLIIFGQLIFGISWHETLYVKWWCDFRNPLRS